MKTYYECDRCGKVFRDEDAERGTTGIEQGGVWETCDACPACGCTDLEAVGVCGECGAPIADKSGDGWLCERCLDQHAGLMEVYAYAQKERPAEVSINSLLAHLFSETEINLLLLTEARRVWNDKWLRTVSRMDDAIMAYIRDAERDFCDYVLEEETNAKAV